MGNLDEKRSTRLCAGCGKLMRARSPYCMACNADREVAASKRSSCISCGRRMQLPRQQTSAPTCGECRRNVLTHGRASTYTYHGCRCGECRAANSRIIATSTQKNKAARRRNCLVCDVEFRPTPKQKICSDACRKIRYSDQLGSDQRRARFWGVTYEPIERLAVYERDGWLCGLCGQIVDRELPWPDLGSVSLDHIVPLSKGGPHTWENVQCACLGCNLSKGDRENIMEIKPLKNGDIGEETEEIELSPIHIPQTAPAPAPSEPERAPSEPERVPA